MNPGAAPAALPADQPAPRELLLHIGLHKTATSYVQRMILENREVLLAHGIAVAPYQDLASGGHHPLVAALAHEGPEAVFATIAGVAGARVLVSAEDLSRVLADRAEAEAVRDAAARHFRVRVMIVLRRQDALKESVYGEAVKTFLTGPIEAETHYDYDHDRRLRLLEAVFGERNVLVSFYSERGRNDVLAAVLAAMDAQIDRAALREVPPQNVSAHRRKRVFLAHVPKSHTRDPRRIATLRVIRRAVLGSGAIADDGIRTLLPPEKRHALVAAHAAGNAALVRRHRLTPPADFLELPDPGEEWAPPRPLAWGEIFGVGRAVLMGCWRGRGPLRGAAMAARIVPLLARTVIGLRRAAAETRGRLT